MKVFTYSTDNKISNGAAVEELELKNGVKIPVVSIGETGRGRKRSVLPVEGVPVGERLEYAQVATTLKGGNKLRACMPTTTHPECILVLRTGMGFRGGSFVCLDGETERISGDLILAEGMIAEGAAGRMGCSAQYILRIPAGKIYNVRLSGRLYGAPSSYFFRFNGEEVEVVSAEERELLDW
jgi:hypothetical protein